MGYTDVLRSICFTTHSCFAHDTHMLRRYQNQCISARKATQKHGFRKEIQNELVREPRTKFLHFRVRKALPTLHFLNEIACRIIIFCQKTKETTAFSVQNTKKKSFGLIGNQPEARPCQPPCVPAFEPLDLLLVKPRAVPT